MRQESEAQPKSEEAAQPAAARNPPPAPPTLEAMSAALRERLAVLTARTNAARQQAKAFGARLKPLFGTHKAVQALVQQEKSPAVALAQKALARSHAVKATLEAVAGDLAYQTGLRQALSDAHARAWLDYQTLNAQPAEAWFASLPGQRTQNEARLEAVRQKVEAGERRWEPEEEEEKRTTEAQRTQREETQRKDQREENQGK